MKKLISIIGITILIALCGCSKGSSYDYLTELSEIEMIQIVELTDYNQELYQFESDLLFEIEDVDVFLEELSAIECKSHYTSPIQLDIGDVVIKIIYTTGEYELISDDAQYKYRLENSGYGFQELNKEQFNDLIEKYIHDL